MPLKELERIAGSSASALHSFALGIDPRPVIPASSAPKSFGEQETFSSNSQDEFFILAVLRSMTDRLCRRLRDEDFPPAPLRCESVTRTWRIRCDPNRFMSPLLTRAIFTPCYNFYSARLGHVPSLRLVGVRLTNLHAALPEPELALTGLPQKCYGKTSISGSFGPLAPEIRKKAILRGHDLWLRKKLSAGEGDRDSLPGPGKN